MTEQDLEKFVDLVLKHAIRCDEAEGEDWQFHRAGVKSAVILHIAVMQALREMPLPGSN